MWPLNFSTTGMRNKGRQNFKENKLKKREQTESFNATAITNTTGTRVTPGWPESPMPPARAPTKCFNCKPPGHWREQGMSPEATTSRT
jgi:hypothetical protein